MYQKYENESELEGNIPLGNSKLQDDNNMNDPDSLTQINTLDESVTETICRDVKMIGHKIAYVLIPRFKENNSKLRDWDWWGPLMLCIIIALTLSIASNNSTDSVFGSVFLLIWIGSFIVTLNAQLLGGKVSFFQCVCVLGYSLFPICCAIVFCVAFKHIIPFVVRIILGLICWVWSTIGS